MEFTNLGNLTGLTENYAGASASALSTGDLRRSYGAIPLPRLYQFNVSSDVFFAFVSRYRKFPVTDPQLKYAEERPSFHRRYAYVCAHGTTSACSTTTDATVTAADITAGSTYYFKMGTDYKSNGNIGIVYDGRTTAATRNAFQIGSTGTKPIFFIPNQLVKIPFHGNAAAATPANSFGTNDSITVFVKSVTPSGEYQIIEGVVITALKSTSNNELAGWGADTTATHPPSSYSASVLAGFRQYDQLERARSRVVGNMHTRGSGFPDTRIDQPYSMGMSHTQIWKNTAAMDGTTMATEFKYIKNEFKRNWQVVFSDHKWDIETDLLFSSLGTTTIDGKTYYHTQGIVDYVLSYCNLFELDYDTTSIDTFLTHLSVYYDCRYNNRKANLFMCDKYTLNWFLSLGGYALQNALAASGVTALTANSISSTRMSVSEWRDVSLGGPERLRMYTVTTPYGDMNLVYNPHLDGTGIAILAVNLDYVAYMYLNGNGYNRDTTIYPGVQTINNSGVDGRVDLIQTEAGLLTWMPEAHAAWLRA